MASNALPLNDIAGYWFDGALRTLDAFANGFGSLGTDPAPTTPYEVIYEGGKVSLRHYRPETRRHATPLLIVYALIKRPFVLDLQPGKSVVQNLLQQGYEVYMIDWIPPQRSDAWRGFDAYVNEDLANAVRAVQIAEGVEQVSLLGYCFGALLSLLYTALHPDAVKNLITLTAPFDMGRRDLAFYNLMDGVTDAATDLVIQIYGNCPAWMVHSSFTAMSPIHHAFDKYVGLYRNAERDGYAEMFDLFERWMHSDVPLAGRIYQELVKDLFKRNALVKGEFKIAGAPVELAKIACPLLNVVAEYDDVVHPSSSLPLPEFVGSWDKRNLTFPTGHLGAVVSSGALSKMWPQIGTWLSERDA
jgi:polyhydroxyalkanoate synthase